MFSRQGVIKSGIPRLVDSHAHLELEPLVNDPQSVVGRALDAGVVLIVTVGIDLEDARRALEIADSFDNVFAGVGFHPHNAATVNIQSLQEMISLTHHHKVVAYGEIGLDFFRDRSPRDTQISVFSDQLEVAKNLSKPVIIHLRDAYSEGLQMLEKAAPWPYGGVIHCFSGTETDAKRALDLGFYLSVPGTITYKKNEVLRKIISQVSLERILIETDCPYLSPEPLRGRDNEPAFIIHTAKKLAEIHNVSIDKVADVTTANAARLFNLPLSPL
jgi:TatD DNase family protein